MFLLVPAYPGCPGSKAVKRSLLSAIRSLCLVMSECSLSGHGHGHMSNFYIVDLENLATASRRYTSNIHNSTIVGLFVTLIRQ